MKNMIISGANAGLSEDLAQYLTQKGYCTWKPEDPLDLFIYIIKPEISINHSINEPLGFAHLLKEYEETALKMLKAVSEALPLFKDSESARICFINSINSSINRVNDFDGGYERIINAACNMAIKTMFNRLRPLGYTFRVYAAYDIDDPNEGNYAAEYFLANRSFERESFEHSDENRLVMRDKYEQEIPW
jgi:hypothetical protein